MRNYIKKYAYSVFIGLTVFGGLRFEPGFAADFHSARTQSLGGAGHAGPFMTDSIYLNPSFLAFQRNYAISGNYSRFDQGSRTNQETWNAAVSDGANPFVQAGLAYTHRIDATMYHLATGYRLTPTTALGISGKAYHLRTEGIGDSKFNATISATWAITPMIQTAFIFDNIFNEPTGKRFGNLRTFTLGSKFNIDQLLLIYIDPSWVQKPFSGEKSFGVQAGAEIPIFTDFFLRGGTFRSASIPEQARRGDGWGAGVGWIGPKLSLDYSYCRIKKPLEQTQHTGGLTIFF
jgi:hypothetical protein